MIETKNLTKKFDSFTAVDSLDLRIETGEFFGLLGPNGAGKTTTISLLSTLLLPTEGEILIDGQTLGRNRPDLKRKISVITQEYSMRQDMNMDEIMEYQGRLYFMPRKEIKRKTEELLDFCGLLPFRKRTVRKLSGGMKRKLMVCRALLTSPEILLLDEPTAGMDALSRRQMWNLLRQLNGKNLTILLTTHYMEEAQSLCNRVALMDHGKLEEINTPSADRRPGQIHRRSGNTGRGKKPTTSTVGKKPSLFCPLWTDSAPFGRQLWRMFLWSAQAGI
mgnify:CR=1 FL=1